MPLLRRRIAPVVLVVALLAGCSGSEEPTESASETTVDGVPGVWLDETTQGWPESDGYGSRMPMLQHGGECLLADDFPEVLGAAPEITESGWGPFGEDAKDKGSFRYLCGIWTKGQFSGQMQLIVSSEKGALQETVDEFTDQPDTSVQENTVTKVDSAGQQVHVLQRWYPTNPQGEYQALYVDKDAGAAVTWEVNSLDETDFEKYTSQQAADDLMATLEGASGGS